MKIPNEGDKLTQEEINLSINLDKFSGAEPGRKNWHYGQFEPWALNFGYPEGKPIYAEVKVEAEYYHIYYLNDKHACPIILKQGQKPEDYGVNPKN